MIYQFNDSSTQSVSKTLLIAVAGPTGAGKTESGMRIATGLVGPNGKFAVIDTENRRALNKKSRYRFQHLDLQPPYNPENFWGAIKAAIEQGNKAVFVDSFSAEWDGEGGLHDEATDILERISKGDPEKAHAMMGLSWKKPKQDHKRLMGYLRKCDIPIIFGLRAEPKIKFVKDEKGKTQVVDAGWLPIAEKLFGYDMLIYALMMAENPGVPVHLKKLEPEFEAIFPMGKQINEECGRQLAKWAAGDVVSKQTAKPAAPRLDTSRMTEQEAASILNGAPTVEDCQAVWTDLFKTFVKDQTKEVKARLSKVYTDRCEVLSKQQGELP